MDEERDLVTDRIVTIYVSLDGEHGQGMVFEKCSVRTIGGRAFLLGTAIDVGQEGQGAWVVGIETAVAIDTIKSMHFMTPAQFEQQMQRR